MKRKIYQEIAALVDAYRRCLETGNQYADTHIDRLLKIEREYLPHGSGIDSGCNIDLQKSSGEKVVITFGYHFMDENGFYAGWDEYRLTVKASLMFGFDARIVCIHRGSEDRDRRGTKEYFYQLFDYALNQEVDISTL